MPDRTDRIAIVGIGGIFPGARDLDHFWENIKNGIDAGRHVPADRWFLHPEKAFDPHGPQVDRVYSTWGCFIDHFQFDPKGLNLDETLLERLDPLFHLGLFAAQSALRDARQLSNIDLKRVGVILGNIALPTESTSAICRDILGRTLIERLLKQVPISDQRRQQIFAQLTAKNSPRTWDPMNRFAASLPAALIAEAFNLGGAAYTLDAACASSLYALKFACEELRAYRADAMLAGGMSRPDCQYTQMGFAQLKALSRQGRCAPLSAAADGLVVGEGAGVFVLKRLGDAIVAGDQIYGVIAGIGLSNDRGANLLAPHSDGQLRAMKAAYQEAGWKPSDVDLIECHATGTPVGDGVEIASLHQLWENEAARPRQCVIGGVKSNVGHLLTGAGAAGLMKILLALKHQVLPPTANFKSPAETLNQPNSPFRVLAQPEPWAQRNEIAGVPRRATVNAFGFGGINAHVLVEEFLSSTPSHDIDRINISSDSSVQAVNRHNELCEIAVVGICQQVGGCSSRVANEGEEHIEQSSDQVNRDWGVEHSDWFQNEFGQDSKLESTKTYPIKDVRLPLGSFRIPPLEMQDMLPQQQLMLLAASDALNASTQGVNISQDSFDAVELGNRTGVFVGIELDSNTTNFHLRWSVEEQASAWAEAIGLELTASELADWTEQLKNTTGPGLTANRVMGNLGGIVASRLAREFNIGGPSFTISSHENSGLRACEIAVGSLRRGELDRAIVGAVDLPCDIRNLVAARRESETHDPVSTADGVTALVLKRLDDAIRDGNRIHAVIRQIHGSQNVDPTPTTKPSISSGAATGLVSLAAGVLALKDQILDDPARRVWLRNRRDEVRHLHVAGCHVDGRTLNFELHEGPRRPETESSANSIHASKVESCKLPSYPIVIEGHHLAELSGELNQLAIRSTLASSIHELALSWFQEHPLDPSCPIALALVVKNLIELPEVIRIAHGRLRDDVSETSADRRVYFARNPLGRIGRLAFVFPGSGNAFLGMGRDLLATFPEVLNQQDNENERLRDQYRPDLIWQASSTAELLNDHKAMIFGQVALGTAICDLLARFNVSPLASIGYSLGESAALFGLRAWIDRDEMLQRMDDSALFGSDLVAPFNAARRAWNLPEGTEVDWVSGVIDQPADLLRRELAALRESHPQKASRVYILIINSPNQCVVGGLRSEVLDLATRLSAKFVPFSAPSTVHCEILRQVEPAYRSLHLMRTKMPAHPIDFYSTAWGRRYDLNRESAAEAIVAQAVDTIDFPRVIEQAYADGVRLFVEIGPGSSCTRMIDEILGDRVHSARAATPVTSNPVGAFVELLAALIAERIPVDLSEIYGHSDAGNALENVASKSRKVVTQVGGAAFEIPVPATGWKFSTRSDVITILPAADHDSLTLSQQSFVSKNPAQLTAVNGDHLREEPRKSPQEQDIYHSLNDIEEPGAAIYMTQMDEMLAASVKAHETYLRVSSEAQRIMAEQLDLLAKLPNLPDGYIHQTREYIKPDDRSEEMPQSTREDDGHPQAGDESAESSREKTRGTLSYEFSATPPRSLSREQCMEFAIGKIGRALGISFAEIDNHPTRVRLPDEPLMLVDRILEIEGEPLSMTSGRVVTEHDIHPGAWYLDCNRIPTCIAVEAGQADLFLSGWLGIDLQTKGLACYRLLDAVVTFHRELPGPNETIHYNIRINHFFRQGQTYLFRFEFDSTVNGQPLLTMRDGCAGFFTEAELAGGKGIIHTALDRQPRPGKRTADYAELVPMSVEQFSDDELLALRRGQLSGCFGSKFEGLPLSKPVTIPGLTNNERTRMWLIDRVLRLDPSGGKYGLGTILGELDIHPDDWFLTCHFCDDQVMPGTLMYECCQHTLRIFLLRMGWIGEEGHVAYEPVPGVRSRLKCRGQVRANTKKVWYEISLKEIGYSEGTQETDAGDSDTPRGTPYCLADALMYGDGKPIVEITDMSIRLSGLTRTALEALWSRKRTDTPPLLVIDQASKKLQEIRYDRRPALFDTDRITAFAIGKPSDAFGDRYQVFDSQRVIARLPGPPFQFLDRIVSINGCQPWVLQAGGEIVAQYDVPPDAWYFAANRQKRMPFAVLLETALQPCGWLAAYVGSALSSETDLSFRNLGGSATQFADVTAESGTLTTTVKMTRLSNSGGMIIQHYDFDLRCEGRPVYVGNTYFGFFSHASLANQIGIRDAKPFVPSPEIGSRNLSYIDRRPFAGQQFQMIDEVDLSLDQGPAGLGFVMGRMTVKPESWFFKAHFYQDPVVPGSLGLESFFQLLKLYAAHRWNLGEETEFTTPVIDQQSPVVEAKHEWVYRGQVIPRDKLVTVSAVITKVDDQRHELTAEGYLSVDGRTIYQMKNFSLGIR